MVSEPPWALRTPAELVLSLTAKVTEQASRTGRGEIAQDVMEGGLQYRALSPSEDLRSADLAGT